jgi:hypothetical protein
MILKMLLDGYNTVYKKQLKAKTYKEPALSGQILRKLKTLSQSLNISQKVPKENQSSNILVKLDTSLKLKVVSMKLLILILIMLILIMRISLKLVPMLNKLDITLKLLRELTGNTAYPTYLRNPSKLQRVINSKPLLVTLLSQKQSKMLNGLLNMVQTTLSKKVTCLMFPQKSKEIYKKQDLTSTDKRNLQ